MKALASPDTQDPSLINCAPLALLTQISNVLTNCCTLTPFLCRADDGSDRPSLNPLAITVVVYIMCAEIDTALVP